MKIKFLKSFRLYNIIGDDITIAEGAIENIGEDENIEKEDYAQWLIDNGFAEKVDESRQLFSDVSLDKNASTVNVSFQRSQVDDGTAQKFIDYLNAVNTVVQDKGITMDKIRGSYSWEVMMRSNGKLGIATSLACTGLHFYWSCDAKDSIEKHPNEWRTIVEYKWGK